MFTSKEKAMAKACKKGNVEKVKKLLQKSPSLVNEKLDLDDYTALHWASEKGYESVVQVLLAANADIEAQDRHGRTPLYFASLKGYENMVKVLLAANADINAKNYGGWTPLHCASMDGHENVVKVLLAANADIEAKELYCGETPLHLASRFGHESVVKVLLAANADIEAKTNNGWTLLHYASHWGKENVVKVLLEANADINAKNNKGKKPGEQFFDSVNELKKQQIRTMLKEERDKRNKKQQQASTPSSPPKPSISKSPPSSASCSSPQAPTPSSSPKPSIPKSPPSPSPSSSPQVTTSSSLPRSPSTSQPPTSSTSSNSQTQEAERIGKIKCKYNGDAIRFTLKKTTTFKELIGMVEGQWGEGKGVKFQDEDQDWVIMNTNDDVVEVWEQTKMGIVSLEVFSTQQNQPTSSTSLPTASSTASSASSGSTNTPSSDSSSQGQVSDIGWETSNITPPARCFKQSPQLSFEDSIRALLLGLSEAPPGRPDLRVADEDDVDTLIYCCEHALSQMEASGSADVRQVIGLLARDEALAILAYTCEDPYPVYRWVNAWLVQDRRDPLVKSSVGPYFRLLYQGLEKLPQKSLKAGRGVLVRNIPVLRNCFNSPPSPGATISFWGISSFSLEDGVASQFGGGAGEEAIYYSCGSLRCVLLGGFSMCPSEAEVLPLPPAVFKVHSTFKVNEKKLVISLDHDETAHARFSYVPPSRK